jgi:hypothetical protein
VHRREDLVARPRHGWPLLVKANIGGSGRHRPLSDRTSCRLLRDGTCRSVDKVLLLQDYAPRGAAPSIRWKRSAGDSSYAIEVESGGDSFDLCPRDAAWPSRAARIRCAVTPRPDHRGGGADCPGGGLDVGGVEC